MACVKLTMSRKKLIEEGDFSLLRLIVKVQREAMGDKFMTNLTEK